MSSCGKCGREVPDEVRDCPQCGTHHGFPNVKLAASETAALESRWSAAYEAVRMRGCERQLAAFHESATESHAVANVDVGFLHHLLTRDNALYAGYSRQVAGGTRLPAAGEHDRYRAAVEGQLFGTWGDELTYAALALDGRGLASYGNISLELKDSAIEDRSSLLEENSYSFVQRHRLVPGDPLPHGFRSPWSTRARLAATKVAPRIEPQMTLAEFPGLLLSSGASRDGDDFVEVHIFGTFSRDAISQIQPLASPKNDADRVLSDAAQAKAANMGIQWP